MAAALLERYRLAGMKSCGVYLHGDVLVLITEAEDLEAAQRFLAADAIDREWQQYVAPMKTEGDYQEMKEIFRFDW
jgi:hypothetical protein